jgi:hypothetical protein
MYERACYIFLDALETPYFKAKSQGLVAVLHVLCYLYFLRNEGSFDVTVVCGNLTINRSALISHLFIYSLSKMYCQSTIVSFTSDAGLTNSRQS